MREEDAMPKFIIEREISGAGNLCALDLQEIATKSCSILNDMGPQIQWLESFITADKIYCIYIAPNKDTILEHSAKGSFPANQISEITNTIDPTTAESNCCL